MERNKKIFKKYPSIENHYNKNKLDKWLSLYPKLENEVFCIEKKYMELIYKLYTLKKV